MLILLHLLRMEKCLYNELEDFSKYASKEINQKLQQLNHNQHHYIHTVNAIWEFSKRNETWGYCLCEKGQTDIVGWGVVSSIINIKMIKILFTLFGRRKETGRFNQNIK